MSEISSLAEIIGFVRNFQNGRYGDLICELCKARIIELEKNHVADDIEALKELAKMMGKT